MTAKPSSDKIDDLLHRWSTWVENGCLSPTRQNVTHFLKVRSTGVAGSKSPDLYCVEFEIEQAVSLLAQSSTTKAHVVRHEYNIRHQRMTQFDKAVAVGLSLRTYQRHLKAAKDFITEHLDENRKTH